MSKLILCGIAATILIVLLKQWKPEFAGVVGLATCVLFLFYTVSKLAGLVGELENWILVLGLPKLIWSVLLKIVGIAYLSEVGACICKDSGQSAIAAQIEACAKLAILAISLPIVRLFMEQLESLL